MTDLQQAPAIDVDKLMAFVFKAVDEVGALLTENAIHTLVLGAAAKGAPGPLVSHFSGERAGNLPCVVVIVPGGLSPEAIDRLA